MSKPSDKPTLLRWFCPRCMREHSETMTLSEAASAAATHLLDGAPYALLYDAVQWEIYQADKAEAELTGVANHPMP